MTVLDGVIYFVMKRAYPSVCRKNFISETEIPLQRTEEYTLPATEEIKTF
jgi:hypothetical protein